MTEGLSTVLLAGCLARSRRSANKGVNLCVEKAIDQGAQSEVRRTEGAWGWGAGRERERTREHLCEQVGVRQPRRLLGVHADWVTRVSIQEGRAGRAVLH